MWDRLQTRIHKPLIGLHSPQERVRQTISISTEPGTEAKVSTVNTQANDFSPLTIQCLYANVLLC